MLIGGPLIAELWYPEVVDPQNGFVAILVRANLTVVAGSPQH